jgi:acylphosphatase
MQICQNILIKGLVQGVSYRKQTKIIATNLGVNGWIRNLDNGTVEACLEGEKHAVDALVAWCAFGPKKGKVDEVQITQYQFRTAYSGFKILDARPGVAQ